MSRFVFESTVNAPLDRVFAWYQRPGALTRLIPPWMHTRVLVEADALAVGERVVCKVGPFTAVAVHTALSTPDGRTAFFTDEIRQSLFRSWRDRHEFHATTAGTLMRDVIDWSSPWLPKAAVHAQLRRMFGYRRQVLIGDLAAHARTSKRLTVAISGASGLLGSQLTAFLTTGGHEVRRLVRRPARHPDEISWDPQRGTIESEKLVNCDVVVNLAGEQLLGRWTKAKMRKIFDSRTRGTQLLATTLADLARGSSDSPRVLVNASAIGYYAGTGEELTEEGPKGTGFLSDVVEAWERSADPAREANLRVVHPRMGIVLTPLSGLLGVQYPIFYAGLGGPLGNGKQWLSWVSHDDAIGLLHHALVTDGLEGPVNVVAPNPVTGRQFADELGAVLRRPAKIPVPMAAVQVVLGRNAAREFAAANHQVVPQKALASGYSFRLPELTATLRHTLGREQ